MELLAGLISGILVSLVLLKHPITININKNNTENIKHEEIYPEVKDPGKLSDALNKGDGAEDEVYAKTMTSIMDEFNGIMRTGGDLDGETRR